MLKQASAPGVITASPTAKAFDRANAMIQVDVVQLNKLSPYLADLPNKAYAAFLVSPQETPRYHGGYIGPDNSWHKHIARIRNIDESSGLHFKGQTLTGMKIFDRPENAPDAPYEKAWAGEVRAAWEKAKVSGRNVTTGLAMGTRELMGGQSDRKSLFALFEESIGARRPEIRQVTNKNNLHAQVHKVNAAIALQGGERINTIDGGYDRDDSHEQMTSTESATWKARDAGSIVAVVDFGRASGGRGVIGKSSESAVSSRAVALEIFAPKPNLLGGWTL